MNHGDNYIGRDVSDVDSITREIQRKFKKAKGWVPFETYDMVQCGYPVPDHGEMIIREYGGTNEKEELLPPSGMWCKVEDIKKLLKQYAKKTKN